MAVSPIPGPIDIDFIEYEDNLYLIEVNTRFGGGYPVSHLAGANFPARMVADHLGEKYVGEDKIRKNVVMTKKLVPVSYENLTLESL